MKLTRRSLVGTVAAIAAVSASKVSLPASAQTPVPSDAPLASPRPRFQQAAQQLAAFKLPRNIEPAMRFEA